MVVIQLKGGVISPSPDVQYIVAWTGVEDIEGFLEAAVIKQAAQLGLKVTYERTKDVIAPQTQRPT